VVEGELFQLTCECMENVYSAEGARTVCCHLKFDAFIRTVFSSVGSKWQLIERFGEMCDLIFRKALSISVKAYCIPVGRSSCVLFCDIRSQV